MLELVYSYSPEKPLIFWASFQHILLAFLSIGKYIENSYFIVQKQQ